MSQNIYHFILRYSWKYQILLLLLTISSFPFLYYSLELPKQIINQAIGSFDPNTAFLGYSFTQVEYLLTLTALFLLLVILNGIFKYYINTFKGRLGERMLRRLRYELYTRVLRFPLGHFKKLSSGEIISMVTIEVEPLGGFSGEAFAQPVFQGGTLFIYILFIFLQDPYLGLATVMMYPFQGFLISRLQQRVNQLGKQRVRAVRQISTKIGETVNGAQEIHNHDMSLYHKADISFGLGKIFNIRYEIYQRKFAIKFINNFINQLTPFFLYSIGGYLVIIGQLSFGSLVAVLAAYKDMAAPWRELLVYYQFKEDSRIKYKQVIEQFQPSGMLDTEIQEREAAEGDTVRGVLELTKVGLEEIGNQPLIDSLSCRIQTDKFSAFVGNQDEYLPLLLARLLFPNEGTILLNEKKFTSLPQSVTGRKIGYIGPTPYLFSGSLRRNILYGLGQRPAAPFPDSPTKTDKIILQEAYQTDNSPYLLSEDWFHAGLYYSSKEEFAQTLHTLLERVDLRQDIYEFGLQSMIQAQDHPDLVNDILKARQAAQVALRDSNLNDLVYPFKRNLFNPNATVIENLLFGTPIGETFLPMNAAKQPYLRQTLEQMDLTAPLVHGGYAVAQVMVEIFSDLSVNSAFLERFSFISPEDLPILESLLFRLSAGNLANIDEEDKTHLLSLAFKLIPNQHRLGIITADLQEKIIQARHAFIENLPSSLTSAIEFFDFERYNNKTTIRDNILFGRILPSHIQSKGKEFQTIISSVLDQSGLRDRIIDIGMESDVGIAGSRLSTLQRQKINIVRTLLKKPEILIIDRATAGFDPAFQEQLRDLFVEWCRGKGLIWFVHTPRLALDADVVFILEERRVREHGSPEDLMKNPESVFSGLFSES